MKFDNAFKKLSKYGDVRQDGTNRYYTQIGYDYVSFRKQGDDAVNFMTIGVNEKSDAYTDYFPQFFHDNLTQAIKFAINTAKMRNRDS